MITLFQHQQQALDLTEGHNRCAYYLDMGLGKTFVGSEKALTLNSRVNLLICQTIAKIMSLEDDINTRIDELVTMKKEAFSMISKVPDLDQQNVLVGRYIQLKKWEDLAAEFEYTTQWLFEIHGKALLAFAKENADFLKEPSKV